MDLAMWDPRKDDRIELDGEWEFYWGELLSPDDMAEASARRSAHRAYMDVPSTWNGATIDGQRLPAHGSATYRLRLVNLPHEGLYALKKANIRFASTVFVNGHKLLEDGTPSLDPAAYTAGNSPQFGSFAAEGNELEIIVHVSNYQYVNAGIPISIAFGEQEAMLAYQQKSVAWEFVVLAILGTLSLIFLLCFVATTVYRSTDYSLLASSVVSLLFVLYTGLMGERALLILLGDWPFETVYRIKDIASLSSLLVLTTVFYQLHKNRLSLRVAQAVAVMLGTFCLLVAFVPIQTYVPLYSCIIVIYQLFLIWLLLRVGAIYIRGSGRRMKPLFVYMAFLCVNLYSIDMILFASGYKAIDWLAQLYLVAFNSMLTILVVMRFFEAYRTVEKMTDRLIHMDRIKDDFLSNTSHELKTPLNAIVNIAETLQRGAAGAVGEEQAKNLEVIAVSGRRLTYLVNGLLDYSRLKHGDIPLYVTAVDLPTAVDSVMRVHQFLLEGKPVAVRSDVANGFPALSADSNRLQQILHNLIENAIKFTERGTVTISATATRDTAAIQIADTGSGIDPAMQERIFLPFEQLEDAERLGGSGLGLSITKKLVELHGGTIRVDSDLGSGSVFTVTLPLAGRAVLAKAADRGDRLPPLDAIPPESIAYPIRVQGKTDDPILVVDDDAANLRTIMNLLSLTGHTYTVVDSGRAALSEVEHNPKYSLLILDIMMPDISGYEVLRQLRERFSPFELPVLMLTASNRLPDVKRSLAYGANDIVGKPYEAEELMARVESLTRLKASVKQAKDAEIAFLRSQIKPHFLYNALNSIAELCVDEPRQAEKLIVQLSQYLRKSFDFRQLDSYTTLAGELELVRAYVRIEQARFGSRLHVEYDVQADEAVRIPPLIVQPLVENAIRHGLMSDMRGGTVRISIASREGDRLELTVEDNGCGIGDRKLQELRQGGEGAHGVGLWNIRKHLKLMYGTDIGIESAPGQGTKVSFAIPVSRKEAEA